MKRLMTSMLFILMTMTLTACSGGYGKTEPITDADTLSQMNTSIAAATEYYFDTTIPEDETFNYEAFKSFIPSPENKKEYIHHSNIFQAAITGDAVEGQIASYGGVLSPDGTQVTGLILNVFNEKVSPQTYSVEELEKIAVDFLRAKELVGIDESITLIGTNDKASSSYIKVLNLDSDTKRFAVGVNLQFGTVVYFEHAPLEFFK